MPKFAVDGRTLLVVMGCVAALAACGSTCSREPKPAANVAAQIPGDGGGSADAAAAEKVVQDYIGAFADGNGSKACDLMTDAGIAGVVDDGETRTVDEAYQLCLDTVQSLSEIMDSSDASAFRGAQVMSATVDGDTAKVETSLSAQPIELVRTDGSWRMSNAPTP